MLSRAGRRGKRRKDGSHDLSEVTCPRNGKVRLEAQVALLEKAKMESTFS